MMRLRVLGSSGTAPAADNPASGYLVETAETTIWMDCGSGTYMALLAVADPAAIDAVLLSHMHADHCSDLFALFHGLKYVHSLDGPVPVVAPDGSIDRLRGFVGPNPDHALFEVFAVHEAQPGEKLQFGDITVSAQAAHHSVPALAFRLEADGVALGYTGDTGPSDMITEHFSAVDTMMAEASLPSGDSYPFHLTGRAAGAMAAAAGAGRLILTHIPEFVDPQQSLADALSQFHGDVGLARPGDVYMI